MSSPLVTPVIHLMYQTKTANQVELSYSLLSAVEERWNEALDFFRSRGHVLFISDRYRFWDHYGFTQQSLAKVLVENGVSVTWLDGISWKQESPVVRISNPNLKVGPLKVYPGRRFSILDRSSIKRQLKQIRSELSKNSLIWVQGSLDDRIAKDLPIEVFSVFDDCGLQPPFGELTKKAKVILCQNAYSQDQYRKHFPEKSLLALPPVELSSDLFKAPSLNRILPTEFPQKIMGYLGACFPKGFDFDLLERFISSLPDWGFVICGRTNEQGKKILERFSRYSNFYFRSWIPREMLASLWLRLSCNLLLYKDCSENRGAFPIKVLESLFFGVPSVATRVPKTSSLEGICPVESNPERLLECALKVAESPHSQEKSFDHLFYEMHPKIHLARVAEALKSL